MEAVNVHMPKNVQHWIHMSWTLHCRHSIHTACRSDMNDMCLADKISSSWSLGPSLLEPKLRGTAAARLWVHLHVDESSSGTLSLGTVCWRRQMVFFGITVFRLEIWRLKTDRSSNQTSADLRSWLWALAGSSTPVNPSPPTGLQGK